MAITATTLAGPLGKNDVYALLTATTGAVAGAFLLIGNELCQQVGAPQGNVVLLRRGLDGSAVSAHAAAEPVQIGLGSDIGSPAPGNDTSFGVQSSGQPATTTYTARGALAPVPGGVILAGASVLAMTLAAPTQLTTGTMVITSTNPVAHTITVAGGLGGGGASFDVITMPAAAQQVTLVASNGKWCLGALGGAAAA